MDAIQKHTPSMLLMSNGHNKFYMLFLPHIQFSPTFRSFITANDTCRTIWSSHFVIKFHSNTVSNAFFWHDKKNEKGLFNWYLLPLDIWMLYVSYSFWNQTGRHWHLIQPYFRLSFFRQIVSCRLISISVNRFLNMLSLNVYHRKTIVWNPLIFSFCVSLN